MWEFGEIEQLSDGFMGLLFGREIGVFFMEFRSVGGSIEWWGFGGYLIVVGLVWLWVSFIGG